MRVTKTQFVTDRLARVSSVVVAGLLGATIGSAGCVGEDDAEGTEGSQLTTVTSSNAAWTVFADPYGDGTWNPAQDILPGQVTEYRFLHARTTTVTLAVAGLPPHMLFEAHVHKLSCAEAKGGGHYQDQPAPDGVDPKDPAYANPTNEMHFHLMTDDAGNADARSYVKWLPRDGEARSLVIHDVDDDGMGNPVSGPRIACLDFTF